MINVRALANPVTQNANPNITVIWQQSNGYTQTASFQTVPAYLPNQTIQGQVQGVSGEDQKHIDYLNLTGVFRSVHLFGNAQSNVRKDMKGGDLLLFPQFLGSTNDTWLVVHVKASWDTGNWSEVIVQLQQ